VGRENRAGGAQRAGAQRAGAAQRLELAVEERARRRMMETPRLA